MQKISEIYKQFLSSYGVSTDSRDDVNNKIFFALSGENFNGNKFAADAKEKGARICVIDDPTYFTTNCILVPDVLTALQQVAQHHRINNSAIILAITGTNGKTTTKELISAVLGNWVDIISTNGNYNNHIGVPLTLLRIQSTTKIAVIEMGANHIGEINTLCEIAQPDLGIITNIGKAHLEGFGSFEGVISTKNELYEYIKKNKGKIIVNSDDELLVKLSKNILKYTYGTNNANIIGEITGYKPFLKISWGSNELTYECHSQLYGKYNFSNIMAAIAAGVYFEVPFGIINKAIASYSPENNRSQIINTKNNSILLDAYNANPTSMSGAITSFSDYNYINPYLILGDMFELGIYSSSEHQAIVDLLNKEKNVILIGNEFGKTINHSYLTFNSTEDTLDYLSSNKIIGANILIKGSRGMKLEKLLAVL